MRENPPEIIGQVEIYRKRLDFFLNIIKQLEKKGGTVTCAWSHSEKMLNCAIDFLTEKDYADAIKMFRSFQSMHRDCLSTKSYPDFNLHILMPLALSEQEIQNIDTDEIIEYID